MTEEKIIEEKKIETEEKKGETNNKKEESEENNIKEQTSPVLINDKKPTTPTIEETPRLSGSTNLPSIKGGVEIANESEEVKEEKSEKDKKTDEEEKTQNTFIYALRTTANREEQVMDFVSSNAARKKLGVYAVIRPHGMRGYIFLEAINKQEAEQAAYGVPYAKGILASNIQYSEIEHMLEQVKKDVNIQKNDIAEILTGPFKREKCKITRIDKTKDEVVVELLEAAVPIPITLKIDAVKVIRRETDDKQ